MPVRFVRRYPPLGPQRQMFAALTPQWRRNQFGSPPLPCSMVVYLRAAPGRYLAYVLQGEP